MTEQILQFWYTHVSEKLASTEQIFLVYLYFFQYYLMM